MSEPVPVVDDEASDPSERGRGDFVETDDLDTVPARLPRATPAIMSISGQVLAHLGELHESMSKRRVPLPGVDPVGPIARGSRLLPPSPPAGADADADPIVESAEEVEPMSAADLDDLMATSAATLRAQVSEIEEVGVTELGDAPDWADLVPDPDELTPPPAVLAVPRRFFFSTYVAAGAACMCLVLVGMLIGGWRTDGDDKVPPAVAPDRALAQRPPPEMHALRPPADQLIEAPEMAVAVDRPTLVSVNAPPARPPAAVPGMLRVQSDPPGATVFVDGTRIGVAPVEVPATGGPRRVVLLLEGYVMHREVTARDEVQVTMKAAPRLRGPGGIKVRCSADAPLYVFVDDKPTGLFCPTDRIDASEGSHRVVVYDPRTDSYAKHTVKVLETRRSARLYLP